MTSSSYMNESCLSTTNITISTSDVALRARCKYQIGIILGDRMGKVKSEPDTRYSGKLGTLNNRRRATTFVQ